MEREVKTLKPHKLSGIMYYLQSGRNSKKREMKRRRGDGPPFDKVKIALIPYGIAVFALTWLMINQGFYEMLGVPSGVMFLFGFGLLFVGGSLMWLVLLYKHLDNTSYIISPDGIEISHQFIHHSKNMIRFDEITDIELEQPLSMRPFDTGNIILNTAGSKQESFKIRFVEQPKELQNILSNKISDTSYAGSEVV